MAQSAARRRAVARSASLPAPVGGWNARDSVAAMAPTDAVQLVNWWPTAADVQQRAGCESWATGLGSQVESLLVYNGATTSKLFGAAGTNVYNCTSQGAVGAAESGFTITNDRLQATNITTAGGSFMLAVNGVDKLIGYTGAAWYQDGDGTHDITGVNTATCSQIMVAHNRVWLMQKNTLKAWYLPTSSIAGAATAVDMSSLATRGGYLMNMGTWTIDYGTGVTQMVVFLSSQGEMFLWQGADPASSATWSLVGVWQLGNAVSARGFQNVAGDLVMLTLDGLVPAAKAVQSSRVDPRVAVSDKIRQAITEATSLYQGSFGWALCYVPKINMLILNVPVAVGSQQQFVMNTQTGAWAKFTGWAANCWALFNDDAYYGGNGTVYKAWQNNDDAGVNINSDAQQAFNYFGSRGTLKRFTGMRPILQTNGRAAILAGINVDFDTTAPQNTLATSSPSYGVWGTSTWPFVWGGALTVQKAWQGVTGIGYCAAPRVVISSQDLEVHWVSTDLWYEPGAFL